MKKVLCYILTATVLITGIVCIPIFANDEKNELASQDLSEIFKEDSEYEIIDISTTRTAEGERIWEDMATINFEISKLQSKQKEVQLKYEMIKSEIGSTKTNETKDISEYHMEIQENLSENSMEIQKRLHEYDIEIEDILNEYDLAVLSRVQEYNEEIQSLEIEFDNLHSNLEELNQVPTIEDFVNKIIPANQEEWMDVISEYGRNNDVKADVAIKPMSFSTNNMFNERYQNKYGNFQTMSFSGDPLPSGDVYNAWNALTRKFVLTGYTCVKQVNGKNYTLYSVEVQDRPASKTGQFHRNKSRQAREKTV